MHHFSPLPSETSDDKSFVLSLTCALYMFTITIENLLHFLECFDDKMIATRNFPLNRLFKSLTHSCIFYFSFAQMWKDLACKYSLPSWILSCGQQVSSSFQVSLFKKMLQVLHKWIALDCEIIKIAEENEDNIKLNVSPSKQNIK